MKKESFFFFRLKKQSRFKKEKNSLKEKQRRVSFWRIYGEWVGDELKMTGG